VRAERDEVRVRLGVVRDDHRLVQGVAAGALPRAVVDGERVAVHGAPGGAEDVPRRHDVRGRVAGAHPAEVDDRAQAAVADEQARAEQVGVDPHRRPAGLARAHPAAR